MNIPPINNRSPCLVSCDGHYLNTVMGYAEAKEVAMELAAKGHHTKVYRLIEETCFGQPRS